jgi:hypothetical protein
VHRLATLAFLLAPALAAAQPFVREAAPFPVRTVEGRAHDQPFLGGLFEPRPSLVDLDGDGDADLVLNVGGVGLQHFENVDGRFVWRTDRLGDIEPTNWSAFGDLDGDGDLDLLTRGEPGRVRFFRNTGVASAPAFALVAQELQDAEGAPLQIEDSSIPVLADADGDGLLDLLSGKADIGTITLYRGLGTGADATPRFAFVTNTYQGIQIYEPNPTCGSDARPGPGAGSPDMGAAPHPATPPLGRPTYRHGANAMAVVDLTGDGAPELLWGDFFSPSLFYYLNVGAPTAPAYELVTDRFPIDEPITSGGYNAPSFGDVDRDGTLDLIVGVQRGLCFDRRSTVENLVFFENTGTGAAARYSLRSNRFLDMVDIGTRSTAALADLDGDGDLDLVLGNETDPLDTRRAKLLLFLNEGSATAPDFRLADDDWLGLAYDFGGYGPAFGDLDADGDLDLLVGGFNGRFAFLRNNGSATAPAFVQESDRFQNIDAGQYGRITLGDLDGDGRLDAITGASNGRVRLYRNAGTPQEPAFATETNGLPTASDLAYSNAVGLPEDIGEDSAPHLVDLDGDGDLDLLIGTATGEILVYRNNGTTAAPSFVAEAPIPGARRRVTPTAGDLTGNGRPDLLAGSDAGGLLFWRHGSATDAAPAPEGRTSMGLQAIPNPATGAVSFRTPERHRGTLVLFDSQGREVRRLRVRGRETRWDGRDAARAALPAGAYLAQLRVGDRVQTLPFTRLVP